MIKHCCRTLAVIAVTLLISSCASMSKDECLNADWRLIGFEDGAGGTDQARIGQHRKACANHGVTPDLVAYDRGYKEGIYNFCSYSRGYDTARAGDSVAQVCPMDADYHVGFGEGVGVYCTYDVGLSEGRAGKTYQRICPPALESAFLDGYDFGKRVHSLESRIGSIKGRLAAIENEHDANRRKIEELKNEVAFDDSLDGQERSRLLGELEDRNEKTSELNAERIALEVELSNARSELARLGY